MVGFRRMKLGGTGRWKPGQLRREAGIRCVGAHARAKPVGTKAWGSGVVCRGGEWEAVPGRMGAKAAEGNATGAYRDEGE